MYRALFFQRKMFSNLCGITTINSQNRLFSYIRKYSLFFLLLFYVPFTFAEPYPNESRVFNLVTGEARLVNGISITGNGAGFIIENANSPWKGVGPDGNSYDVTTYRYSYMGVISLSIDPAFYSAVGNCSFDGNVQVFVGWTVMQPGITGNVYNSAGASYFDGFSGGVGVQSRWVGVPNGKPEFIATFNNSSLYSFVYVSTGPQGLYTMPGGKRVYVHNAGMTPNSVPYTDIYGLNCGAVLGVGTTLPSEPLVPETPNLSCNFSMSGDINLGSVDKTTALGTSGSTILQSICSGDADVIATIRTTKDMSNVIQMGGLTIPVTFDNNTGKLTYQVRNTTALTLTKITAQITAVASTTPGEYSEAMIVSLSYW